ncbi:hypothetical protein BJV78DRAFT_1356447 [Lactifluus subvellereus]|nr:hypothetical protein BJV78DRAFT_1356447 [Lactifluus subvellereus]
MVSNFPSPVLSLAADAIKDLDGGDTLSHLWTIFTKCKESLQDGRRLENISWRLWHRELSARSAPLAIALHLPHPISTPCPLTPVSERGIEHPGSLPLSPTSCDFERALRTDGATKFSSSTSPIVGRPLVVRSKSVSSVGKIICDIIPHKLDLASTKPPTTSALLKPDLVIVAADPGAMVVAPIPSMLLPPPSTQPPSVAVFPRVVVVNPTPHPTPPATPVPTGPPAPLPSTGQHLAPPPRLSAAVARHNPPDATTPANPVPTPLQPPCPPPVPMAAATVPSLTLRQSKQALQHPQPHPKPKPQAFRPLDGTLKPSDRRFFLQQDQSPSPERDGPDRGSNGSISTGKSPSETGDLQPSSVTSNQTRVSTASASSHPTSRGRRSKNPPVRPPMTRLNSGRHVLQVTRKEPTKPRPPFHPNSDKAAKVAGPSRPPRSPVESQPPATKAQTCHMNGVVTSPKAPNVHAAPSAAPRRGIVVSHSSSDYETTDTDEEDDDSWASEDISEGAVDPVGTDTAKRPPTKEETGLRDAALEAQRQRELFVKQPKRSYSNLGRTQSGLLSQLLNPDPNILPPGRPYRVASTHDVTRPGVPSALTSGKSSAALPLAAQVTAQAPIATAASSGHGGYRPKGRPQGEELEDESDSPDDPDDTIQVSRSLAQQRLAALANPSRRRASDNQVPTQGPAMTRPILPTVATAPIPLNHPWNLPTPAPPTTPRTTRRQMLATELSESLRRNLLWERQVSKTNLLGNAGRRNGLGGRGGAVGGGLRPLTTMVNGNGTAQTDPSQQDQQQHQDPGEGAEESIAERRRRALARNRTWADDFHYAGW